MANDSTRPGSAVANRTDSGNNYVPRVALERVLARAVELQSSSEDAPDAISEERLAEIAKEVGIDVTHLRQALAEERARMPMTESQHGFLLDAFGEGVTSAQRTVPGTPAEIISALEAWMPRMEQLALRRRIGERITWESRRSPLGNLLRAFGIGGRRLDLMRADQVSAMVTRVDDKRSIVRFDAEFFGVRRAQRTTFVVLSLGLLTAFMLTAIPIGLFAVGAAVPAAIGTLAIALGGVGALLWRSLTRSYRQVVNRAHLRLEQILDDLERGQMNSKGGLIGQVREVLLGR